MPDENELGGRVGLDTTNFKAGINDLNRQIRVVESGFQAAAAGMDDWSNNSDGLSQRLTSLNKIAELQKQKVDSLQKSYDDLKSSGKASQSQLDGMEISINNATKAYNKTQLEISQTSTKLDEFGKEADQATTETKQLDNAMEKAEKTSGNFGEKLRSGLVTGAKAAAASIVALGAAAGALAVKVVQGFGELEQNLGGAESVFGKYADTIEKKGEDAYKTLGISQSDYLAAANKMGSLFQGSGIDQQKSLDLTAKAMQRAADVASVMGIDTKTAMESITGAAKGNFTMMDNLGVAMNDTTLKAYALSKGFDFTWESATNAQKAEVAMQMFFEKTSQYAGNFERESTETISGSLGLMKASVDSWVAGLGNANADTQKLTANMVDAFSAVVKNITPILDNIVAALPTAIDGILTAAESLVPQMIPAITGIVKSLMGAIANAVPDALPELSAGVVSIINAFVQILQDNGPMLINAAVAAVVTLATGLIQALPQIVDAAITLVISLANALTEQLPSLIPVAIKAIYTITQNLMNNLPLIIDAAIQLIIALVQGLMDALPMILEQGPKIMMSMIQGIVDSLPKLIDAAPQIIVSLIMGIINAIPQLITMAPQIIMALISGVIQAVPQLMYLGPRILKGIWDGLSEQNWGEIGGNILKGIIDGFGNAFSYLKNGIQKAGNAIVDGFKNFFGIHSPSVVMQNIVGKNLGLGIVEGIRSTADMAAQAMSGLTDTGAGLQVSGGAAAGSSVSNNYYGAMQDVNVFQVGAEVVTTAVKGKVSSGIQGDQVNVGGALGY